VQILADFFPRDLFAVVILDVAVIQVGLGLLDINDLRHLMANPVLTLIAGELASGMSNK
jgi:hypothetical protein